MQATIRTIILGIMIITSGNLMAKTAAEDSLPVYRMGEILIIADRLPMITATSLEKMDGDQINRLDIHNPAEALQFLPGLHVYRMAKNEVTLNLRGFEQRQISVFLDGVPISVPYDGNIDLSQLTGDQLESIRVSRGSTSTLFGANTLGGSINLISGNLNPANRLNARFEGSAHEKYFGSLGFHNRIGPLRYSLYGSLSGGADFTLPGSFIATNNEDGKKRDNSDFENLSAGVKLKYEITNRHTLGLNAHYLNNSYGISPNTKTNSIRYWRFPKWQKNVISLNTQHLFSARFMLRTVLFYDTYFNLLKSYDDAAYATQNNRYAWNSTYDDYSTGILIYPSFKLFSFGSTNLILSHKRDVHREEFRNFGFDKYEMATSTVGLEQDIHLSERNAVIAGADLNYLEPLTAGGALLRDPILLANGQIAYQYRHNRHIQLHGSLAKKSRYPTLKELYSERLGRTIPNPELKAEHAYNTEIGIHITGRQTQFQANMYYNTLRDLITQRQLGNDTEQLQNIGKGLIKGVELDLKTRLAGLTLSGNYSFMEARNTSAGRVSRYLPNRPAHIFNLIGDWQAIPKLNALAELTMVAGQRYENPDNLIWDKFNDYMLINFKLDYRFNNHIQWYIRLENMFDRLYENDYGVPMPGREILSGVRISI